MQADLKTDSDLAVELEECFERSLACLEKVSALETPYDEAEKALEEARERFEKVQERYGEADKRYEEANADLKRVMEEAAAAGLIRAYFRSFSDGKVFQAGYEVTEKGKAYLPEDKAYY